MNKEQLCEILEACLLYQDGLTKEQIIEKGVSPEYARMGVRLNKFLQENVK